MTVTTLSQQLREFTRREHESAENSNFMVDMLEGKLTLADYTQYLINMAWIYSELEKQSSIGEPTPGSEDIWDARLNRLDSITADLEALGVHNWRETTEPNKATRSYMEHLASLNGRTDPRLIAHHYTRYLGDLSGGQAIGALVARHYGATPEQLSFYAFDDIENIVRYKGAYREALDSVVLDDAGMSQVLEEARLAFVLNQRVFEDLIGEPVAV